MIDEYKHAAIDLTNKCKPNKKTKVMIPHSIKSNGGKIIKGKLYKSEHYPEPILKPGYKLQPVCIGCGYLMGNLTECYIIQSEVKNDTYHNPIFRVLQLYSQ